VTRGQSSELRDVFSLLADPGLKELKDRYFKDPGHAIDRFGTGASEPYFEIVNRPATESGVYTPIWFENKSPETAPDLSETFYLTWKTEETEPKQRTFEAAKKDVEAAWKLGKARELAEAAAKDLQKKMADAKITDRAALVAFAANNKIATIDLEPLAKNKFLPNPHPGLPSFYQPPRIPPEKVEFGFGMTERVLELRDKQLGATIVVPDLPKSKYFVAILLKVTDVTAADFQQAFAKFLEGLRNFQGQPDPVLAPFEFQRRDEYNRAVMATLRAEAKVTTVPDEMKKMKEKGQPIGDD
jgi:hypothetical protein